MEWQVKIAKGVLQPFLSRQTVQIQMKCNSR